MAFRRILLLHGPVFSPHTSEQTWVGLSVNKLKSRGHVDEFYVMAPLLVELWQIGETPELLVPRTDISTSYYRY